MYQSPAVHTPSVGLLSETATKLGLDLTQEELTQYREMIGGFLAPYTRLDQLPEPSLPVKYPRTPGHRPSEHDNPYNAWYWRCDIEGAAGGKLAGKTVAIKDNIPVAGVPMMNGARIMEGYTPEFDATVVTRILDAGGRIRGKAACESLCFSGNSFTADKGPVHNPHDKTRSTGGSSCGSGALIAGNIVDMALGGDQAGSIRIPASWCGIIGHKPTWGLVPYTGIGSIEPTIDHIGPMTRTVQDCALLLEVIAGYDNGLDARQPWDLAVPNYTKMLTGDVAGMKIVLIKEGFENCEQDVCDLVHGAADKLKAKGVTVEEVSLPWHKDAVAVWGSMCLHGTLTCVFKAGGLGVKGFYPTSLLEHQRRGIQCRPNDLSPTVKLFYLMSTYIQENYGCTYYAKAQNVLRSATKAYDDLLAKYDVLVMPTVPFKAPKLPSADTALKDIMHQALNMIENTAPFDATGHPALTINAGFSEGLPVGMMIVGKHWDDATVLKVAHAYEQIRDAGKSN